MLALFENAVSRVPARDGRFPQVAGVQLAYDASVEGVSDQIALDTATRVKSLIITRADGTEETLVEDGEVVGDLEATYTVATNSFLLTGGDGYQGLNAAGEERGAVETELGERQILIDYITEVLGGTVEMEDPSAEPRVVRLDEASE